MPVRQLTMDSFRLQYRPPHKKPEIGPRLISLCWACANAHFLTLGFLILMSRKNVFSPSGAQTMTSSALDPGQPQRGGNFLVA